MRRYVQRNITAIKEAEEQLEKAYSKLIELSGQAGISPRNSS